MPAFAHEKARLSDRTVTLPENHRQSMIQASRIKDEKDSGYQGEALGLEFFKTEIMLLTEHVYARGFT
jgi:hypothetical protein